MKASGMKVEMNIENTIGYLKDIRLRHSHLNKTSEFAKGYDMAFDRCIKILERYKDEIAQDRIFVVFVDTQTENVLGIVNGTME